jgi:hypothetical protein
MCSDMKLSECWALPAGETVYRNWRTSSFWLFTWLFRRGAWSGEAASNFGLTQHWRTSSTRNWGYPSSQLCKDMRKMQLDLFASAMLKRRNLSAAYSRYTHSAQRRSFCDGLDFMTKHRTTSWECLYPILALAIQDKVSMGLEKEDGIPPWVGAKWRGYRQGFTEPKSL